ncbi:MAG: VanZ family protein [Candidatus Altiarchaeota archaeon]
MFNKIFLFLEKRPKFLWLIILLYMALIFYLSSVPYPPQPITGLKKEAPIIEHIIEFIILGILLVPGFRAIGYHNQSFVFAILFGVFYGISDEIHQYFVPGRYAELSDILANSIGVLLGSLFSKLNLK